MTFTIRYNARTVHLEGIAERTTGPATDNSAATGVVAYYAQSACAALTRSGTGMAVADTLDTLADALTALRDFAESRGLKVCANCQRAATATLEATYDIAQRQAQSAEAQREYSAGRSTDHVMEGHEARAERTFEAYRAAADAIGRCLIFGCEEPTHESNAHCREHSHPDDIEGADASAIEAETAARHEADRAALMLAAIEHDASTCQRRALGEPCEHCEPLFTALEDARVAYRKAVDDADGSHDQITLAVADAALIAYQAAAREAAACLYYGCAAVVDDGSGWCHEHGPKTVRFVNDDYDPAVAAAGRASTQGKPYTPTGESYGGCEARIHHNGVGSPCARPRGHEGGGGTAHRTTTGIEWMPGQTRPSYCPYARTTAGCDDCKEHAELVDRIMASGNARTYTEAEALAAAMENEPEAFAPLTVDPEAAYNARRALYRTASDLYEEHGGEANRAAAAAAWDAFVAAARLAGKCIDFTCYADAEPGADHCQRHHKRVTARLDHTEPGKAIALIEGAHGREHAPQAWLAHEGGSWLLVDDYDGDTLNVKGPDAERAVHAWAALLGLRIDALAVEVEYAGGPVSPPVREPEAPAADNLDWTWVSSGAAADVFVAGGRAHVYRVTEHADAAGASLVATLRGTTVDTYQRGYMTADDARKAAEHYEARYGSVYVPAE